MPENEITNILKDIKEQGFPLEVRTSEILEAHDWEITNQFGYLDHEEKKQRTVDILARKNILFVGIGGHNSANIELKRRVSDVRKQC